MTLHEHRELALACACHIAVRLALRAFRFKTFLRLATISLPPARRPLTRAQVVAAVQRSRRVCGGSCLTESVVMNLLATRHRHPVWPLKIGVAREGGALRAHAWSDGTGQGFAPLWTETPRSPEKSWPA